MLASKTSKTEVNLYCYVPFSATDGTLTIEGTQEHDHGKYECVAENEIGVAYSSPAMLYIKGNSSVHV